MIEPPRIVGTAAQPIASIRLCVPSSQMMQVMGPGLAELNAALAAQGIGTAGAWFTHHFRRPTDTFDFEICLPVAHPVAAVGRVQPGLMAATTVARTVYHGNYDGLGNAWGELMKWIAAAGHATAADFWECYRSGPESSPNPADWRTELNWPLIEQDRGRA